MGKVMVRVGREEKDERMEKVSWEEEMMLGE